MKTFQALKVSFSSLRYSGSELLLGPEPGLGERHPLDLLLQLEEAVHERLGCGRAPRHVDIHRHNPVTASATGSIIASAADPDP